ncbi:universal stress protein [Haloplanus halobius]|uniref:universal stress protein n=1 Tax=Haloplanus halobius TaxID=2934938 RepID=UPI00200F57A2
MFDTLLFPTDGSEGATAVFDHVLDMAAATGATVHVINVADTTRDSVTQIRGEVVDTLEQEGRRIAQEAADRAADRGVETVTDVLQGEPHRTIVDYAESRDVDLVVMPTHGRRGLERVLLGSTTERVVRRSEAPVLTIRPDDATVRYPYRNVLVPTDGSDCAADALSLALDIVTKEDATSLHILSVVDVTTLGVDVRADVLADTLEEDATEIVEEAASTAADAGVDATTDVEFGTSVARTVRSYVDDHDIDLVVTGTHGRTGLDRYVLGSVADRLIRTSPVPVLTVRSAAES